MHTPSGSESVFRNMHFCQVGAGGQNGHTQRAREREGEREILHACCEINGEFYLSCCIEMAVHCRRSTLEVTPGDVTENY